jgi:hypothetical protein
MSKIWTMTIHASLAEEGDGEDGPPYFLEHVNAELASRNMRPMTMIDSEDGLYVYICAGSYKGDPP